MVDPTMRLNEIDFLNNRIAKLQSTITAQAETIKRLKEDGERLAKDAEYENETTGRVHCAYCNEIVSFFPGEGKAGHKLDCPITLHTQLMQELEAKE